VHDVNILDEIMPEPGLPTSWTGAYIDFQAALRLHAQARLLRCTAKSERVLERRYSHPVG